MAAPHAFAHPNWRTSNFVNSFQTERAIAVLNALWATGAQPGGSASRRRRGRRRAGRHAAAAVPARSRALRLDGVPWKYPLVPLKIGVFQEMRDNVLTGQPYQAHGWFIYRQNPMQSPARTRRRPSRPSASSTSWSRSTSSMNDTAWYSDVVLPEALVPGTLRPADDRRRQGLHPPARDRAAGREQIGLWIFKELGKRLGLRRLLRVQGRRGLSAASSSRRWA